MALSWEHDHAVQRGAGILCEVVGYGLSGDAHHITAPNSDGSGPMAAMTYALNDAGLQPSDVTFLAAHATSTPLGDAAEASAIRSVFKDHCQRLHITAFKSAIGHLQAAAGAVESIFAMLAVNKAQLPAIRNLNTPDTGSCTHDMNFARQNVSLLNNASEGSTVVVRRVAVVNSFGFGGTNASLCIRSLPS
eukprot:scpid94760/ scgid5894/ 3-oxoacyl-[acyl-carrier-protein] synthase, mitochondrial; Beta-ketoacyl-ACP synthase